MSWNMLGLTEMQIFHPLEILRYSHRLQETLCFYVTATRVECLLRDLERAERTRTIAFNKLLQFGRDPFHNLVRVAVCAFAGTGERWVPRIDFALEEQVLIGCMAEKTTAAASERSLKVPFEL
jgi:hypothetical protein